ncbi:hypothetical protein QAO71_17635 (plasmid) [Halopseudomonas sp. SMJS2]|uniref:hypothetical protein n=1 Tax=Halopseudomonas sp. SMJS2 TaxID=3041098 RepID=UPI002452F8C2|nr:hypothetical protein [Halopseudomonas sp. SMJS2]WGK63364.1 hypothetical protein QAO71_17635 [Halopseudomonas sp. SMJS2]
MKSKDSPNNLTFDHIEQHNAEYPREIQIAKEVSRLLKSVQFPDDRVWVDLRFDYSMSDHSSSSLDLMRISGDLHGIAVVKINGLYLHQDFISTFNEVVPHELAHIIHELNCKDSDLDPGKKHSEDWEDIAAQLSPEANPCSKVKGLFDDRASKILKGGVCVECECGDEDAFAVFPNSVATASKLRTEDLLCKQCTFPYVRVTKEKWPDKVKADIGFLEGVRAIKFHHQHLQR